MSISDFIQGFIIGSSLIIAIGPQNLYVINQGLKKNFIFIVVLICSLSDSLLIIIGIYLSNNILRLNTSIITIMKLIGGIWLILYGINKIKNSKHHIINNKVYVLLKPINTKDYDAEKWSNNSLSIELEDVKGALTLAKAFKQYENGYLYFNMDLSQ